MSGYPIVFKQNFSNHLQPIRFSIWNSLIYSLFFIPLFYPKINSQGVSLFFGILCGLIFLPPIYLHIEYTIRNWKHKISFYDDRLELETPRVCKVVFFREISEMHLFKTLDSYRFEPRSLAMVQYHFLKIITKSGETMVITCLMCSWLELYFSRKKAGVKRYRRKHLFATSFLSVRSSDHYLVD